MANIASQVILHPTVGHCITFGATTLGRDKAYRALQYFARFFAWYLVNEGDKSEAARWSALKAHLGTARKLMRIGKPMEHLQAAMRASITPGPVAEQITSIARQIAYFGYLSLDVVVWANSIEFITLSSETAKKITKTSFRLWFTGIVFSIINGILKSARLTKEARRLQSAMPWGGKGLAEQAARETNLNAVEVARSATRKQFAVDLLDVWIPAVGAELLNVNEGILGICGLASSILGAQLQWQAINGEKC